MIIAGEEGDKRLVEGDAVADGDFIDENLFDGEDLDFVEEELENFQVVDWCTI